MAFRFAPVFSAGMLVEPAVVLGKGDAGDLLSSFVLPVLVTFFSDKSFTFEIKSPPAAVLLLKATGLQSGSAVPQRDKVGKVTREQLAEIAKIKMQDLNCTNEDAAISMIAGTARSMGITVDG